MKAIALLLFVFLISSLVAISCPSQSVIDRRRVNSSLSSEMTSRRHHRVGGRWLRMVKAANKTKQLLLLNRKNYISGQRQHSSKEKDEEDLTELQRLKVSNSSSRSDADTRLQTIESSMLTANGDDGESASNRAAELRQFSYGSCRCPSTSFVCSPTNFASVTYESTFLSGLYFTTATLSISTCSASSTCSTVCKTISTRCGRSCTTFTSLTADYYTSYSWVTSIKVSRTVNSYTTNAASSTSSSATVYSTGCTLLSAACIAIPAAAVAIAVGVGSAAQAANNNNQLQQAQAQLVQQQVDINFLGSSGEGESGGIATTPFNLLPIPVPGPSFPNEGNCSDDSILFAGNCYPVLRRGPCPGRQQWLTVDPLTLKGRCIRRLCGRDRVFVNRDGLCHDADDPFECGRGGRKLFYTAYGDPICDCPTGYFPFPGPRDDCVALFTRGPCRRGEIVTVNNSTGALICSRNDKCGIDSVNNRQLKMKRKKNQIISRRQQLKQQLIPADDGLCYLLGSSGPCPTVSLTFDYDVFKLSWSCVNVSLAAADDDESDDAIYNQIPDVIEREYDFYRIVLVYGNRHESNHRRRGSSQQLIDRKQGVLTSGVFQVPAALPDPLLNPCRPGAKQGNNFKCSNTAYENEMSLFTYSILGLMFER